MRDVPQVVVDSLGDPDGVLVVDETGDLKKGACTQTVIGRMRVSCHDVSADSLGYSSRIRGRILPSQAGVHHAVSPSNLSIAGTTRQRMMNASTRIATARPRPIC